MLRKSIAACGLALALTLVCPGSGSAQDLRLTIDAGKVTLVARNVSIRRILAEWERVGSTSIPNKERIPDGPVTLNLTDVSESSALSTLLRSGNGYLAVARPSSVPGGSLYRTVLLMAAPVRSSTTPPPPSAFSRGDGNQNSDRRQQQGGMPGNPLGGLRLGSPFAVADRDGQDPQDDDAPADPTKPGLFQMRVVGPNGQVITVPVRDGNVNRSDPSDAPSSTTPGPTMVPTAPAGATRPGEVTPVPPKRPGPPVVPSRPPG